MYKAVYAFSPDAEDQITLNVGDVIGKCKDVGNGWFLGNNKTSGKAGLFPSDYVKKTGSFLYRIKSKKYNPSEINSGQLGSNGVESLPDEKKSRDDDVRVSAEKGPPTRNYFVMNAQKILASRTDEYRVAKGLLGVFAGIMAGGVLFVLFVYSYAIPMPVAGGIAACCSIIMALAFALTTRARVVGLVTLPSLSTGRGRAAIFSLIAAILLSGPVMNITNNGQEIGFSMACSTELAYNKTKELQEATLAPLLAVVAQIETTTEKVKALARGIIGPLKEVEKNIKKATDAATRTANALRNAARECSKAYARAFNGCRNTLNSVKKKCEDIVKKIPKFPFKRKRSDNWGTSSQMVRFGDARASLSVNLPLLSRRKRGVCDAFKADSACKALKVTDKVCTAIGAVDVGISAAVDSINKAVAEFKAQFTFDVTHRDIIGASANISKTADEIRRNIEKTFKDQTRVFHAVLSWMSRLMVLVLIFVVLQSVFYIRSFLTKDKFDNFYITKRMKRQDLRREADDRETVLPLKKKEKMKYIDSTTLKLSPPEKKTFKVGLITWGLNLIIFLLVILFDMLLYWILSVVRDNFDAKVTVTGETDVAFEVNGRGVMASIMREFISGFSENSAYNTTIDFTVCRPVPHNINYRTYWAIGVLLVVAFLLVALQSYALRLRRKAASYFYPDREAERLDYLTKRILRKRKGLKGKLARLARKSVRQSKLEEKEGRSFDSKFKRMILFWKKTPVEQMCLACEDKNSDDFITCATPNCNAVYCGECFNVLEGVCQICNKTE